jgi:hypothetical protein
MLDDVHEEGNVVQPLDGVIRWIDTLALGCIIELIKRLLCPGLRLRVFEKEKEHRLLARRD